MYLASISTQVLLHRTDSWELSLSHGSYDTPLRNISWSNDGKYLLQVNPKGLIETLAIGDKELRPIQHVPCHDTCAAIFHREAYRQIAVGCGSGQVLIWDLKNKTIRKSFTTPRTQSPVKILDFNCKSTNIASALENGETIIYGLTTNNELSSVKIPYSKSVSAMHFHRDHRSLLGLASDEGNIAVKDISVGKDKFFVRSAHSSPISDFVFSPLNNVFMATCGYDRLVHLYDIKDSNKCLGTIKTNESLTCMDMISEFELVIGTRKGTILVYDLRNYLEPLKAIRDHKSEVKRVCFRPMVNKLLREGSLRESVNYSNRSNCSDTAEFFNTTNSPFEKRKTTPGENPSGAKKGKGDPGGDGYPDDSFLREMGFNETAEATPPPSTTSRSQISNASLSTLETPSTKKVSGNQGITDKNGTNNNYLYSGKSSTPVTSKIEFVSAASPSPIVRTVRLRNPLEENSNKENCNLDANTITNGLPKLAETINNNDGINNTVMTLGNELKDLIRYSAAELSEEFRSSHLQLGMALTKQRLFLEGEINSLGEKIQGMQIVQNVLLEENKRLLMEVEMLKSLQKLNT